VSEEPLAQRYLKDSERFIVIAKTCLEKLESSKDSLSELEREALKDGYVFHVARAAETLSKALLSTYGLFMANMIAQLVSLVSMEFLLNLKSTYEISQLEENLMKMGGTPLDLRDFFEKATNEERVRKEFSHDPAGEIGKNAYFKQLFTDAARLLRMLNNNKLAELFDDFLSYLEAEDFRRSYNKLDRIKKRLEGLNFEDRFKELMSLLRVCFSESASDNRCFWFSRLSDERKKEIGSVVKRYEEDPSYKQDVLEQVRQSEHFMLNILESLLYAAYLARAAKVGEYSADRGMDDNTYLSDVKRHIHDVAKDLENLLNYFKKRENAELITKSEIVANIIVGVGKFFEELRNILVEIAEKVENIKVQRRSQRPT
jgi:Mg2+ and Co2+ transporter CorA